MSNHNFVPISYRDCLLKDISIGKSSIRPPPGFDQIDQNGDLALIRSRKIGLKLNETRYPMLDHEINKIRALSSFKNNLIEHIIRYFKSHKIYHGGKLKYIRRQMMNHFPNWFFKLNIEGKVVDFIPQAPLQIQTNLDYIFKENQIEKKMDFDPKMLTFNPEFIKNDLQVREIIVKPVFLKIPNTEYMNYKLINNGATWSLLSVTKEQYLNLKKRYTGPVSQFNEYLAIILLRYKFLGGINNHLSIPPSIYHRLGIQVELFGTPFNVTTPLYCSPFPDIEKNFGSQGSCVSYPLKSDVIYAANPPYDVQIVKDMVDKFEKELTNLHNTTIYITIPLWKNDFPAHDLLKKSVFLKDMCELDKDQFPFYHYFKGHLIPASNTYLIILSTGENYLNCHQLKQIWPRLRRTGN